MCFNSSNVDSKFINVSKQDLFLSFKSNVFPNIFSIFVIVSSIVSFGDVSYFSI